MGFRFRSNKCNRLFGFQKKMNAPPPVYASSCPTLQSNLSLHSSSYYSEYSGAARRRLSSTGEADTSATSSYEGSDSSENSDESRLEPVSQMEREQLETFFRGLKSQVSEAVCALCQNASVRIVSSFCFFRTTTGVRLRVVGQLVSGKRVANRKMGASVYRHTRGSFGSWRNPIEIQEADSNSVGRTWHLFYSLEGDHRQFVVVQGKRHVVGQPIGNL